LNAFFRHSRILGLAAALSGTAAFAQSPAPAAPAGFTLDTPIETIAADPKGKAVLDKDLPGLTTNDMYENFKGMSLRALQPMANGQIPDDALTRTQTDLAALATH
jgi:hypothetical protein